MLLGKNPMNFTVTHTAGNYPARPSGIISSMNSVKSTLCTCRADTKFRRLIPSRFSATFFKFPTIDGVVKSPIYCVAAHFEILDILYV